MRRLFGQLVPRYSTARQKVARCEVICAPCSMPEVTQEINVAGCHHSLIHCGKQFRMKCARNQPERFQRRADVAMRRIITAQLKEHLNGSLKLRCWTLRPK